MTCGEAAHHRDVIILEVCVQHSLHTAVVKLAAAVSEFAQNNSFAAIHKATHKHHIEKTVDAVHTLLHLFYEENDAIFTGSVGPGVKIGREGAHIASDKHAGGGALDIIGMRREYIVRHSTLKKAF